MSRHTKAAARVAAQPEGRGAGGDNGRLTAMTDPAMAVQALKGGAQDYLVKGRFDGPALSR